MKTSGTGSLLWRRSALVFVAGTLALTAYLTAHPLGPKLAEPALSASFSPPPEAVLPNFTRVHDYLWRGAAPRSGGLEELAHLGVKTIIDFRRSPDTVAAEYAKAQELGINYVNLPTGDFVPTQELQQRFFQIIGEAATSPDKGPVFVHCAHGSDRTGYMIAMWRLRHDHWSIAEAFTEAIGRGFLIHKLAAEPANSRRTN